ncbi:MAG: hypothetical protein ACHQT8_00135 [Chlamydiales bacterium]
MAAPLVVDIAQSLADLVPLVEQTQVRLSFWGTRYVHLPLLNTTLPIDALAAKVIELVEQNVHFDEIVRAQGSLLAASVIFGVLCSLKRFRKL